MINMFSHYEDGRSHCISLHSNASSICLTDGTCSYANKDSDKLIMFSLILLISILMFVFEMFSDSTTEATTGQNDTTYGGYSLFTINLVFLF